jgi:dihydropteroate synthase
MGILNVTPDSFSDGGSHLEPAAALAAARAMVDGGAEILDVGGESTRPGATEVPCEEECRRVLPVIEALKTSLRVRVSIDTTKAEVARRALDAGADLVNDVSALGDPAMAPLVASRGVPVVLMHRRGDPRTMQQDTTYADLVGTVKDFLVERATKAAASGSVDGRILVDPGIGFGKSAVGNLRILKQLHELAELGYPILVGASRKSFLGTVLDAPVHDRLEGSLAVAAYACAQGAHVIRAHDVEATVRVTRVIDAIREA